MPQLSPGAPEPAGAFKGQAPSPSSPGLYSDLSCVPGHSHVGANVPDSLADHEEGSVGG